jgi:uncharacterized phage protein (TIGR02218 family)
MTRIGPGALRTYLANNNIACRADLITLTLADATVYRWTTFETDLTVGGSTYLAVGGANAPYFRRSYVQQSSQLEVDTLDVTLGGTWVVGGKTLGQLAVAGYFDGARLQIDHLIMPTPGDVSLGAIPSWFEGRIASVEPRGLEIALRCKSELEALNMPLPRFLLQSQCNNVYGDTNCGIDKAAYTLSGVVLSATASQITTSTAGIIALPNGHFNLGVVLFTAGALAGTRIGVQSWASPTFTLSMLLPSAPAPGDTFTVVPGCDRSRSRCLYFSNLSRYRGFPHIPVPETGSPSMTMNLPTGNYGYYK